MNTMIVAEAVPRQPVSGKAMTTLCLWLGLDVYEISGSIKRRKDWRGRTLNEVEIMENNVHPDIMRVIHFSPSPHPTLIIPFYPLGNHAKYGGSREQNLAAFYQVLEVAGFLHSRNIVHRDVKSANLLTESEERFSLILSDFGLSEQTAKDVASTRYGTTIYVAPKPFLARANYHWRADMWSIAVVFLEIFWSIP